AEWCGQGSVGWWAASRRNVAEVPVLREAQGFQAAVALDLDVVSIDRMQANAGFQFTADCKTLRFVTIALDDRAGTLGGGIDEAAMQGQAQRGGRRRALGNGSGSEQGGQLRQGGCGGRCRPT